MLKSSIKVYARIKPTLDYNSETHSFIIQQESSKNNDKECLLINPSLQHGKSSQLYTFKFNRIFPPETSQSEFYETVGRPVVNRLLSGYNGAIFAFGQTATGKTHTVVGNLKYEISKGLISRVFDDIFAFTENNPSFNYNLSISSIEIYNEVCYDLIILPDNNNSISFSRVTLMEDPAGNITVLNLNKYEINNMEDVMFYLRISLKNRVVAETSMNKISSRSHFIFTVYLHQESNIDGVVLNSKLHLIDLAGSERLSKNNSYASNETRIINLSLFYLENVIVALSNPQRSHIPYRNSLLTSLLRDSLGGNCCTAMIFTISLENRNFNETIATCRFAQRVTLIKNEPKISFQCKQNRAKYFSEKQKGSEIPILQTNIGKCEKKRLQTPNSVISTKSSKGGTPHAEYMNHTVDHINRGIKLLSTLLNQVPHLIKNYVSHKDDFSKKITRTLGLELPQVNPFTGTHYDEEQKSAFRKFLSTESTNKALFNYLEMNFTYYKYLEAEWHLWNKEMTLMEKLKEAELKLRSANKYGDFPEVMEKLKRTYDKYVKENNSNKQAYQSIQEKKQSSLQLFTDARTKLFHAFEIWWQRDKKFIEGGSNLTNKKYFIEDETLSECKTNTSMNIDQFLHYEYKVIGQKDVSTQSRSSPKISSALSSKSNVQSPASSEYATPNSLSMNIKAQIDFPTQLRSSPNIYSTLPSKTNSNYESPASSRCTTPNSSFINLKNLYLKEINNNEKTTWNFHGPNKEFGREENHEKNSPVQSKHSPMLFSIYQTRNNSKFSPKCITSNSTKHEILTTDDLLSNQVPKNTNFEPKRSSLYLKDKNEATVNDNVDSRKNRPMLSLFSSKTNNHSEFYRGKFLCSSPILSTYSENSSKYCTLNENESLEDGVSCSNHNNDNEFEPTVELKLTGIKDLDSKILSFYKRQHISVIF